MTNRAPHPRPDLLPVIFGGDIGVYALARAFHEYYGVNSVVISQFEPGPIADSRIIRHVSVKNSLDERQLIDAAVKVAHDAITKDRARKPIILANSDWLVQTVVRAREELGRAGYAVPYLSEDLLSAVSDKAKFAELAAEFDLSTPETVVVDFSGESEDWQPPSINLSFPLIAKAARSADYEEIEFEGKRKVFEIASPAELDRLWRDLRAAGFRGRFVAQKLIPGDDTQMRSITAYVDSSGQVTLLAGAQVLLEEHTPNGLGNPAAMITGDQGELFDQAQRFLTGVGYFGFANFDVKVDPRDGRIAFLEVNPRIGRNNYYVTAAGANVAKFVVSDVIDGERLPSVRVTRELLYSVLPTSLLLRYIRSPQLREKVVRLSENTIHPLAYWSGDGGRKRRLYVAEAKLNQRRHFRQWYPELTETGLGSVKEKSASPAAGVHEQVGHRGTEGLVATALTDGQTRPPTPIMMASEIRSQHVWDNAVNAYGGHPMQLWGWGEVKAAGEWTPHRLHLEGGAEGFAQVLVRRLPLPFRALCYVPRGPVVGGDDLGTASERSQVAQSVVDWCRKSIGGIGVVFEPDWPAGTEVSVPGMRRSTNTILYPQTLIIDLSESLDDLLKKMSKKTRQYIRKSERENLEYRLVETDAEFEACLRLYHETAERAGFGLHVDEYYRRVRSALGKHSHLYGAFARAGETGPYCEPIAFLWLTASSRTAFELYGGMNADGQARRANYALKWHAMGQMREVGVVRYDLNGLLNDGISTFKRGFASHENEMVGTFDVPLNAALYQAWDRGLPVARQALRRVQEWRSKR